MCKQGVVYNTLVGGKNRPVKFCICFYKITREGENLDDEVLHVNFEANALDHDSIIY